MSLFPAYAVEASEASTATPSALVRDFALQQPFNNAVSDACMDIDSVGVGDEASLLASDSDEELPTTASHPQATTPLDLTDFYLDTKLDRGNLRVSTLYYPGRPEYKADGCVVGRRSKKARRERRVRRYWEEVPVGGAGDAAEQRAARTQAYQAMLREDPTNERLWLQFIDFQEAHYDGLACVSAATAARSRLPRAPSLRARHHRAAQDHLPIDDYLGLLRDEIAQEQSPHVVTELWVRMVEGVGGAAARCSLTAISELAAAAVQRTRHHAPAYPQILYHLGSLLRSCGLWERLVLLLELQVSLNLPPCRLPTPPPADPRAELKLRELEDKLVCSALPLFSVWGRVERARAAAHWAPATPEEAVKSSDSARDPQAAELAPLLLPLVNRDALCQLAINMLRIVDVPLLGLGGGGAGLRALHGAGSTDEAARRGAGGAGALLPLLAARPPPAPRTPAVMRLIALAIDPPTYFSDDYGHLTWVCGLWSSLCTWAAGRVRSALLAWRVRWHHALLLSAQEAGGGCGAEGARVRSMLRAALRSCDGGWLPAAELARVEALACGAARGARAAAQVLRAAVQDVDAADEELVYIARIVSELSGVHSAVSRWALVSAVLRRSLPNDAAPTDDLLQEARDKVSSRCELIEDRLGQLADAGAAGDAEGEGEMDAVSALLPGAGEWAAARVLLSGQHDLAGLYGRLMQTKHWSWSNVLEASRYHEEASEALVGRAGSAGRDGAGWARALSQLHPHSPLLAAVSGVAPLWAGGAPPAPPSSPVAALGAALPSLLAAIEIDTQDSWRVCARVLRRVLTAAPRAGALLWTLRGEAAARAGEPTAAVTYRAIDLEPSCKWLYVRGATWGAGGGAAGGADGAALEELLLEKQLRTHALSDELTH